MTAIVLFPYGAYYSVSELPTGFLSTIKPDVCRSAWSAMSSFHPFSILLPLWFIFDKRAASWCFLRYFCASGWPSFVFQIREDQLLPVRERDRRLV